MIRIGIALAALAVCAAASAQPTPRATLDVAVPTSDGFVLNPYGAPGRLAIARDGVHYVLLHSFKPVPNASPPTSEGKVDLVALAPDGAVKQRRPVPIEHSMGFVGFDLDSLGVVVMRSGELAVFASGFKGPTAARTSATLFRFGPDLGLKKTTRLGPPNTKSAKGDDAESFYSAGVYLPTPDNGVLLGGGFGPGPQAWWMGKFNLDGKRLWQAGPGSGIPERVAAIAPRKGGAWLSLVTEMRKGGGELEWFLRRYTTDGKLTDRKRAAVPIHAAATVLRNGAVMALDADEGKTQGELIFVDDSGRVERRVPWPFPQTASMIADGDGVAAIVETKVDSRTERFIVRADAKGVVRWRSAAVAVDEIVSAPDGAIAALVRIGKSDAVLHVVRYADP